jgi:hypothetical protein
MASHPPDSDSSPAVDPLPEVRDPRKTITEPAKRRIIDEVRRAVRAHGTFETACEQAGIKLELLEQWMQENAHLEATLVKDRADFKAKLSADAQSTLYTVAQRKLALEMLSRLDKAWAPRTRTTLATQLQDFLDESKRVEPPEVYARMVARLSKYA